MDYKEKLKDPRWQKKKSEIMMRDNFTCQDCGCTDKTLHVHHKTYKHCLLGDPWACPDNDLITLCEKCHSYRHKYAKEILALEQIRENVKKILPTFQYEEDKELSKWKIAIADRYGLGIAYRNDEINWETWDINLFYLDYFKI